MARRVGGKQDGLAVSCEWGDAYQRTARRRILWPKAYAAAPVWSCTDGLGPPDPEDDAADVAIIVYEWLGVS